MRKMILYFETISPSVLYERIRYMRTNNVHFVNNDWSLINAESFVRLYNKYIIGNHSLMNNKRPNSFQSHIFGIMLQPVTFAYQQINSSVVFSPSPLTLQGHRSLNVTLIIYMLVLTQYCDPMLNMVATTLIWYNFAKISIRSRTIPFLVSLADWNNLYVDICHLYYSPMFCAGYRNGSPSLTFESFTNKYFLVKLCYPVTSSQWHFNCFVFKKCPVFLLADWEIAYDWFLLFKYQ